METLDLHGVRYYEVDRLVENFVLLQDPPLRIITGNSPMMHSLTIQVLVLFLGSTRTTTTSAQS
jgi:hypothetical protein